MKDWIQEKNDSVRSHHLEKWLPEIQAMTKKRMQARIGDVFMFLVPRDFGDRVVEHMYRRMSEHP